MAREYYQLKNGMTLPCSAGTVRVMDYLGDGGQGEVYRVELNGRQFALKYYYNDVCNREFKANIQSIIDRPINSEAFAWPLYMVENGEQFGYIMKLRPEGYYDINAWIGDKVGSTLHTIIKACINLCNGFSELYAHNYSYKDISCSNVFFHPQSGDVLIIDNDNVTPNLKPADISGTNEFMAPELVSGSAGIPSLRTDRHSLAVLLFLMLVVEHPFHGKKEHCIRHDLTEEEERISDLYSTNNALFIFSDENDHNRYIETTERAHNDARRLWETYPEFIRKLFRKAFVDGVKDTAARPDARTWAEAFIRLLGLYYTCPYCGQPHFYDEEKFRETDGRPECVECGRATVVPRLKCENNLVMLTNGTTLYRGYFDANCTDKLTPILEAELIGERLRFKNLSDCSVICHSKYVTKGCYTDFIKEASVNDQDEYVPDTIKVNGKDCYVAI